MPDLRLSVRAQMSALIDGTFGCLDAAAETINARLRLHVSKGTISKRMSGQHGWPVDEVMALEDAAGAYPITRMMARRLDAKSETAAGCIYAHSGEASKEAGEAVSAALRAAQSSCGADRVEAIRETQETIEAFQRLLARLEAES